ncbi:phosphate ABC transporter substrate-binding protein PstS [Spelaeicoccus albus]|uniref:Phosphate-binding protein n=1 Tax=Spelaeicoccus albus TaxID=1280376 RepID=A0A7Z0D1G3_9MICO|nr:phosphate ABC transporter substrate-binding protein PstS [Spelaeicoccus albus]NYI66040.1 phosphate transport system substrate-binding protein [Spelaeicoccus albus]
MKRISPAIALAACFALTLSGCGSDDPTGAKGVGGSGQQKNVLQGIGSSAQKSAMDAWIAGFEKKQSTTSVQYSPDGSGAGVKQFLAGAAKFAGSDKYLDDDQAAKANSVCGPDGAYEFPVYISPIAVAFNLPGIKHLNFAPSTIAEIFSGKISAWDDPAIKADNPNAKLPSTKITAVHRSDDSGTTNNFTDYLHQTAPKAWPDEAAETFPHKGEAASGTTGVVQTVQGAEGAIGYIDASAVGKDLGTAKIKVGSNFTAMTSEGAATVVGESKQTAGRGKHDLAIDLNRTTTTKGAYPLVLVSYHLVCSSYKDEKTVDAVKAWEKYVVSSAAQQAAEENAGSAAIPQSVSDKAVRAIDSITVKK